MISVYSYIYIDESTTSKFGGLIDLDINAEQDCIYFLWFATPHSV